MAIFHKHLIIRAEVNNPPKDEELVKDWMRSLISHIGMNLLMGPYAHYLDVEGNRGITSVAIIETSHIAMHIWDESNPSLMQLDVYTCGPLDPYDVVDMIKEFDPVSIQMKYLDREHDLTEIPFE